MKTVDRTYAVLGALLLVTLAMPVEDAVGRPVPLSHVLGVVPFASLIKAVYPGLLGLLLWLLSRSSEGPVGKGLAALVGIALPVMILDASPLSRLAHLGAWERATGHQFMLLFGVVLAAGGCHQVAAGANRTIGSLLASLGVALMAAYHLAPLPSRTIPIIANVKELLAAWGPGGLPLVTAMFSLILAFLQLLLSALALLALRTDRRAPSGTGATIVAWALSGLIPAVALPIAVKAGLVAGGFNDFLLLLRQVILLAAIMIGAPVAIRSVAIGLSSPRPPVSEL